MAKQINVENLNNFMELHDQLLIKKDKDRLLYETNLYLTQSGKYGDPSNAEQLYFTNIEDILMTSKNKEKIKAEWIKIGKNSFLFLSFVLYYATLLALLAVAMAAAIGAFGVITTLPPVFLTWLFPITVGVAAGSALAVMIGITPPVLTKFLRAMDIILSKVFPSVPKLEKELQTGTQACNQFNSFFRTQVNGKDKDDKDRVLDSELSSVKKV